MINERDIEASDRGPLPNSAAASYVTSAIIEAERENRRRAMTFGIGAVVGALIVAFVLLQLISGRGDSAGNVTTTEDPAVSTSQSVRTPVATNAITPPTAVGIDPNASDARQEPLSFDPPEFIVGDEPMTLRGMGPLTIGMTVAEAEAAIAGTIIEPDSDARCVQTSIGGDPSSPVLMIIGSGDFESRTIARIDMVAGNATRSGIGIGSTSIDVVTTYEERIETSAGTGAVDEFLTYVPVDSADAEYRIVMEAVNGEVVAVRNGQTPWVEWTDGCSSN